MSQTSTPNPSKSIPISINMDTMYVKHVISNNENILPNDFTTLPSHMKSMGCKWVFKLKENCDRTLNKHKTRLVAKDFNQKYAFDFHETFSPMVKPATIKVILTLASTY